MVELSGRDETLAHAFATGMTAVEVVPLFRVAAFGYTIPRRGLLAAVAERFGESLAQPLSPEHLAAAAEGTSTEDRVLVDRMVEVQRQSACLGE